MTCGATDDDEHVLARKLVVLVKWEGLHDVVDDEPYNSIESSKLEREPI